MNEHGMVRPALIGGVLLGILSAVPVLNCACCAWVIGGGVLAAVLYVRSAPAAVTLGAGAGLGLLTGAIGGVVYLLFSVPFTILMSNSGAGIFEETRGRLLEIPDLPAGIRDAITAMPTGGSALVILLAFSALLMLAVFAMMGMLGGVLGVALAEKRKIERPGAGPPPPVILPPSPPPPPPLDTPEP